MQVKNALVPNCVLILEKFAFVGVHINCDSEIQSRAPILLFLSTPTIDDPKCTSLLPALAPLFCTTSSPEKPYSYTMKILKCIIALFRTEGIMSQSSSQLIFIVSILSSLTKVVTNFDDAVFNTKKSICTTPYFF